MPQDPIIVVQWSVCPAHLSTKNRLTVEGLRRAMHRATAMWEPVIAGMVEFRECHWRNKPKRNHIEIKVGKVNRQADPDRIAQNVEWTPQPDLSTITLAEDIAWQTAPWPREWFRKYWAWIVLAHELGHVLDIPHIQTHDWQPGLREIMAKQGWNLPANAEADWVMGQIVPTLKRRMEGAEINAYRAYFQNHGNRLWKGQQP